MRAEALSGLRPECAVAELGDAIPGNRGSREIARAQVRGGPSSTRDDEVEKRHEPLSDPGNHLRSDEDVATVMRPSFDVTSDKHARLVASVESSAVRYAWRTASTSSGTASFMGGSQC